MNSEIISLAKQFRLSALSSGKYVIPEGLSNSEFLLEFLRAESALRETRAAAERLKLARFPTFKDFKSFDTDFQKGITDRELEQLANLDWIDSLYNVILIGPPGTGKTHIGGVSPLTIEGAVALCRRRLAGRRWTSSFTL